MPKKEDQIKVMVGSETLGVDCASLGRAFGKALFELFSDSKEIKELVGEAVRESLIENKDKILKFLAEGDKAEVPPKRTATVDPDLEHKLKMLAGMEPGREYAALELQGFLGDSEARTSRLHAARIRGALVGMGAVEKAPGHKRGPMVRWRLCAPTGETETPDEARPIQRRTPKGGRPLGDAARKVLRALRKAGRPMGRQGIRLATLLPIHKVAASLVELHAQGFVTHTTAHQKSFWSAV